MLRSLQASSRTKSKRMPMASHGPSTRRAGPSVGPLLVEPGCAPGPSGALHKRTHATHALGTRNANSWGSSSPAKALWDVHFFEEMYHANKCENDWKCESCENTVTLKLGLELCLPITSWSKHMRPKLDLIGETASESKPIQPSFMQEEIRTRPLFLQGGQLVPLT